jgi:hypothetical protein
VFRQPPQHPQQRCVLTSTASIVAQVLVYYWGELHA